MTETYTRFKKQEQIISPALYVLVSLTFTYLLCHIFYYFAPFILKTAVKPQSADRIALLAVFKNSYSIASAGFSNYKRLRG